MLTKPIKNNPRRPNPPPLTPPRRPHPSNPEPGWIALVGAGPGAPDLLTLRALRFLQRADLVLYDALIDDAVLAYANPAAERLPVGKRGGRSSWRQADITELLVASALAGRNVLRLKGGDPFVFGRGGEEALAAAALGLQVHVVPGVSSAIAAPAAAGIPVTHRGVASHFTVVTGCAAEDPSALQHQWTHLARAGGTLVFLMPNLLDRIAATLLAAGRPHTEPVALVADASRDDQQVVIGTLGQLATLRLDTRGPVTLVVGEVVSIGELIRAGLIPRAGAALR